MDLLLLLLLLLPVCYALVPTVQENEGLKSTTKNKDRNDQTSEASFG